MSLLRNATAGPDRSQDHPTVRELCSLLYDRDLFLASEKIVEISDYLRDMYGKSFCQEVVAYHVMIGSSIMKHHAVKLRDFPGPDAIEHQLSIALQTMPAGGEGIEYDPRSQRN